MDPVSIKWLRTVADVLRDYHRQPEYKFLGGGWNEEGILRRRHVFADTIEDIGKESDGWEEEEVRSQDRDAVLTYPSSSFDRERMVALSVGKRKLRREACIAMRTIDTVWAGGEVGDNELKRMADAVERIANRKQKRDDTDKTAIAWLGAKRKEIGLAALTKMLGVDAANLAKVIGGGRTPTSRLVIAIGLAQSSQTDNAKKGLVSKN
jgi:hypothetical protein